MLYSATSPLVLPLLFFLFCSTHTLFSLADNSELRAVKGRTLMSFKETPGGGNVTFDCSPSGPCIPCSRSEKSDEKYRCSETGYRIRLKCFPSGSGSKDSESIKERKPRATLEVTDLGVNQHDTDVVISATRQEHTRSFIQIESEQISPETILIERRCICSDFLHRLLKEILVDAKDHEGTYVSFAAKQRSFIYFRRKRGSAIAGGAPVRLPTNSRPVSLNSFHKKLNHHIYKDTRNDFIFDETVRPQI
ncbi:hypothetical protein Sango_1029000 [Sesamum angolense]|uniref:Uncharacterized protein n=1 Tax=Sesamum angolense TaxID=2727404 RepID=A0AAE1X0U4_9LAMI|nr:hypothetical protein Sango_1029000 [Sesamum angolense]